MGPTSQVRPTMTVYMLWSWVMRFDPLNPSSPSCHRFFPSTDRTSNPSLVGALSDRHRALNAALERLGQPAMTLDDTSHFRQIGGKAAGQSFGPPYERRVARVRLWQMDARLHRLEGTGFRCHLVRSPSRMMQDKPLELHWARCFGAARRA
jgi:hypothetical protein